jgi:hypothetical protein
MNVDLQALGIVKGTQVTVDAAEWAKVIKELENEKARIVEEKQKQAKLVKNMKKGLFLCETLGMLGTVQKTWYAPNEAVKLLVDDMVQGAVEAEIAKRNKGIRDAIPKHLKDLDLDIKSSVIRHCNFPYTFRQSRKYIKELYNAYKKGK